MTDREPIEPGNYDSGQEFDKAKVEILNHVRSLEFGTPAYLACCDNRRSEKLQEKLFRDRNEVDQPVFSEASRTHRESGLRVTEQEASLLNFQIENRKVEIKGYALAFEAYDSLGEDFNEILAAKLIREKPKSSEEERIHEYDLIKNDFEKNIQQILDEKSK